MPQTGIQVLVNGGAIVVFGGGTGSIPDPFLPPVLPSPNDQPALDASQGFPSLQGFRAVYTGPMIKEFGVMADEKTQ